MRIDVDRDIAGFADDLSVCVHPERHSAADRKALTAVSKQPLEAKMIPVVRGREDPEEIHAV